MDTDDASGTRSQLLIESAAAPVAKAGAKRQAARASMMVCVARVSAVALATFLGSIGRSLARSVLRA